MTNLDKKVWHATATLHACDLCETDDPTYIDGIPGAAVCGNCGFVYVPYRRPPDKVAKAWDNVWGEGYTSAWPMVKARLTYVAEWIDQNIGLEGKSVLDVGAGEGALLQMVHDRGGKPLGMEPSPQNAQTMRNNGFQVLEGTIEAGWALDPLQDIVTILWTLENCGDCIDFLKRAKSFLKPDGHLVVATGSRILVPYKKPFSSYVGKNAPDLHCFRFSVNSLGHAALKAGFKNVEANQYKDSDWLIMHAFGSSETKPEDCWHDNPEEVLQFFKSWRETFP
jgi:SAM-dependent methyltransferase